MEEILNDTAISECLKVQQNRKVPFSKIFLAGTIPFWHLCSFCLNEDELFVLPKMVHHHRNHLCRHIYLPLHAFLHEGIFNRDKAQEDLVKGATEKKL